MSYQIGELILFHDSEGNVDDTAIVLGSRTMMHSEHYYPSHSTELIYKIHLTEDGRTIEYPEHHLRMRASSRKEYEVKYGIKKQDGQ
jgi:hypothetical protein